MNVCLIPARGGSKRIPRKNLKNFCGKPVLAWSIEAAQKSECFDQIVLSTDDEELADLGRSLGAEVPFIRPAELANDHATTRDVVRHGLAEIAQGEHTPKALCCLYATAPFVTLEDIRAGLAALAKSGFAVPVTEFNYPVQRALRILPAGGVEMIDTANMDTRSQDLEPAFHDAGQFYWGRTSAWLSDDPIFGHSTHPITLPHWRVQDIDTEQDWIRAEAMHKALGLS